MLPKTIRAKVPSEYRPIATIRLFYNLFAYMILGRVETQLETHQPEEQHGFRGGRRVEEHLVTTRLVLDKLSNADMPIWIVSLDLSKAFDRVHWQALWLALSEQGPSEHMIWMIQNLYRDQQGQVVGSNGCSRSFAIHGGVRQGCFFFFPPAPFFSRWVWLELFYWAASRHVPFIYRRLRMCRETVPIPSHCSLGAGWDAAGGGGEGGFSQHLAGERFVCDGARDAVKFQETGRIGGHGCMGDLGRPPVDQGIRERGLEPGWDGSGFCLGQQP